VSIRDDTRRRFYLILEVTSWQQGMLAHYKTRSGVSREIGVDGCDYGTGLIVLDRWHLPNSRGLSHSCGNGR
jgi:hypothetical protein